MTFVALEENLLKNLVFVIVALLAWAVKVAVERKEARGGGGGVPDADGGESTTARRPPPPDEVDVVFGQRPIPAPLRPKPRRARMSRVPAGESEAMARTSVTSDLAPEREGARDLGGDLAVQAGDVHRRRGPGAALARLGVPAGRSARDMLRAGILWSEVLAVPRALAGPHRSPAARRLRR